MKTGDFLVYVDPVICACFGGFVYVEIVKTVSPSSKFTSSVVMTTLLAAMCTTGTLLAWSIPDRATHERVIGTLHALLWAGTAIISACNVDRDRTPPQFEHTTYSR